LQKCWSFQLYSNSFKNGSKLCTHISNKPSPDGSISHSCPRWIFLLFYSKLDKLSRFVHKSNVKTYLKNTYNNRLQSATKMKGCIDRTRHRCMLFLDTYEYVLRYKTIFSYEYFKQKSWNLPLKRRVCLQKKSEMDHFCRCLWRSMIPLNFITGHKYINCCFFQ